MIFFRIQLTIPGHDFQIPVLEMNSGIRCFQTDSGGNGVMLNAQQRFHQARYPGGRLKVTQVAFYGSDGKGMSLGSLAANAVADGSGFDGVPDRSTGSVHFYVIYVSRVDSGLLIGFCSKGRSVLWVGNGYAGFVTVGID